MKAFCLLPLVILSFLFLWGCASQRPANIPVSTPSKPRPRYTAATTPYKKPYHIHTVKKGETLWRISKRYNVTIKDLVSVNHIQDPSHLIAGTQLIIPSRSFTKQKKLSRLSSSQKADIHKEGFIWPVKGKIITFFGKTKSKISKGILIQAPPGTHIKAAQSGKVIYSGSYGPFGNTVILEHPYGFSSVYSHNQDNLVRVGQWVSQGQTIATVGATGHVSRPCLHFEIRRKSKAVDPLIYLRSP